MVILHSIESAGKGRYLSNAHFFVLPTGAPISGCTQLRFRKTSQSGSRGSNSAASRLPLPTSLRPVKTALFRQGR
jgi:hypothetical protein